MPKDKKNGERDKKKKNLEEYRKKELDWVNAYKRKQSKTEFPAKHRDVMPLVMERRQENK